MFADEMRSTAANLRLSQGLLGLEQLPLERVDFNARERPARLERGDRPVLVLPLPSVSE